MPPYRASSAVISHCGRYRYALERVWEEGLSRLLIVGLNPSTADGSTDDPTVRRCVGFGRSLGFSGLLVGNLFAARSTSPVALQQCDDPVGPENDRWLVELEQRADKVIVAWGNRGRLLNRNEQVLTLLRNPYCFGRTAAGEPRHPLYLRRGVAVEPL
jgi:hypothetical protein